MATILTRIDKREFDKLADQTNLGDAAREMARLVLVDGMSMPEAGKQFGTSKQRVSLAVERIRQVHQSAGTLTRSGWVRLDAEMPERMSSLLADVLEAYKKSGSRDAKTLAVSQIEHALQSAKKTLDEGL